MTIWVYQDDTDHPIDDSAAFTSADGTNYPGNFPKADIPDMHAVTDLASTGSGSIITYGTPALNGDHYERTVTLSSPPVTMQMVIDERSRRLALGFDYDFGDARGVVHIGTAPHDMEGWDAVTKIANALINTGNSAQTITIVPETTEVTITALEWMGVLISGFAAAQQPIWAASFVLEATDPIPTDYTNDSYWTGA